MTVTSFIFALVLAFAYVTSTSKDRPVWAILLAFSCLSALLNVYVWISIESPVLAIWYASIEFFTLMAILRYAPCLLGYFQCLCLLVAWGVNWLLYYDIIQGSNLVYDNYEPIILAIAIAQLIPACNGFYRAISQFRAKPQIPHTVRHSGYLDHLASMGGAKANQENQETRQ